MNKMNKTTIIYIILNVLNWLNASLLVHPDLKLIINLIHDNGYPIELHRNIRTVDGYLLDLHRIPHGIHNGNATKRPPVFLMHGLMGSAENWVINGPEKSLAYLLADDGYDVWLGNSRGSLHSRKHVRLDPDFDTVYWQFSWHEIGVYDLPASIDYVLNETNQESLFYVGHSQGCTAFFVMGALIPEYNHKIKFMTAMAPAVYMSNMRHPAITIFAKIGLGVDWLTTLLGLNELSPTNDILQLIGQTVCKERVIIQELCSNVLFLLAGYDSDQFNRTLLPLIITLSPGGASVKQITHYAQEINSGSFRQYDFGFLINLVKYGSTRPPDYDLGKITTPVGIFFGNNDWLVAPEDIDKLYSELPNPVMKYLVPHDGFNHLDFLWATDVMELLYSEVLNLLRQFRD